MARARKGPPPRGDAGRKAQQRQRITTVVVGVLVVVAVVAIAVLTIGGESEPAVAVEEVAGTVEVEGEPYPPAPEDPQADEAAGEPAPVVSSQDFDGQPITIGEPGTPQLLMFLASWCPVCEEELPEVVDWVEEGRLPDGVELTAIATGLDDGRPNWPPQDWFEEEGYDGRVLVDDADGTVAETYGLTATPYWVALDADGQAVARIAGMLDLEQLDALAASVAES
jgi:thiol-disulfide isomerase/thioredoxin